MSFAHGKKQKCFFSLLSSGYWLSEYFHHWERILKVFFIVNLISYTSPNLEIVTDWYIQLAFLYIALWKHDFKYLPTYSIALCKKNKKGWIFTNLHIEMLNERVWGKFSFRKDDLSQPFWPSKGNEALSSSLN